MNGIIEEHMSTQDDVELLPEREIVFTDLLRFPRMLLWSSVASLGMAIAVIPFLDVKLDWLELVTKGGLLLTGIAMVLVASSYLGVEIRKRRGYTLESFVEVDERSRKELGELTAKKESIARAGRDSAREQTESQSTVASGSTAYDPLREQSFVAYFHSVREVLERKAAIADEKASILLDKGVAYSRFGIVVFVASIALWQYLAWRNGFKVQHIYGIASCSILFIFIEFLSAWFLKQYRHFVDTSTYLIKVKSIFDRYMLSYHISNEFDALDPEEQTHSQMGGVLALLRDDIKWPDDYSLKNADVSFARETLQSISEIVKATRKGK